MNLNSFLYISFFLYDESDRWINVRHSKLDTEEYDLDTFLGLLYDDMESKVINPLPLKLHQFHVGAFSLIFLYLNHEQILMESSLLN